MKAFDIVFFVIAAALIGLVYYFLFHRTKGGKKEKTEERDVREERAQVVQGPGQEGQGLARVQNVRERRPRAQPQAAQEQAAVPEPEELQEETKGEDDQQKSKKQMMKEAKKQEKKDQREAFLHMLEQREKKEEERRKQEEEKEKQLEEEERKQEELVKKLEEEQRKKEEEEYQRWKAMIAVEEQGLEKDEDEARNLKQKFVEYIKTHKVVMLDDLAAEFKLATKDVIDRIRSLEEMKELDGVIDDRGKYIYITEKEVSMILNYIKQKGRVSRADLAVECNKIIKLDQAMKDKEKLNEEERKWLEETEAEISRGEGNQKA